MVSDTAFIFMCVFLVVILFLWYQGQSHLPKLRSNIKVTFTNKLKHCHRFKMVSDITSGSYCIIFSENLICMTPVPNPTTIKTRAS